MPADESRLMTPPGTQAGTPANASSSFPEELLRHLRRSASGRWSLPESLVTTIAEEIRRFHGGNEVLNRIEAEHLMQCALDVLARDASLANRPARPRAAEDLHWRSDDRAAGGRPYDAPTARCAGGTETGGRSAADSHPAALPVNVSQRPGAGRDRLQQINQRLAGFGAPSPTQSRQRADEHRPTSSTVGHSPSSPSVRNRQ